MRNALVHFWQTLIAAALVLAVPAQAAVTYTVAHEGTFASDGLTVTSFSCTSGRTLLAYAQAMSTVFDAQIGTALSATGWTAITGSDSSASPGWGYASRAFTKTCAGTTDSFSGSATWNAGATEHAKVTVLELQGQDATTPFRTVSKDVVDQAETVSTGLTLSQAPLNTSLTLGFITISSNGGTQTLGAGPSGGFTERHESGVADWTFFQWQDRSASTSTTVDWATSTGLAGGVTLAIEIAASTASPTGLSKILQQLEH